MIGRDKFNFLFAFQVCSEWLGGSVSGNHGDLKRVQQLLVSSLKKITDERQHTSLYGEAVATMESLAVLNAWAEVRERVCVCVCWLLYTLSLASILSSI